MCAMVCHDFDRSGSLSLHSNDLATLDARGSSITNALLISLDTLLVHHGASANCYMVTLGKHPGIEIRGHLGSSRRS